MFSVLNKASVKGIWHDESVCNNSYLALAKEITKFEHLCLQSSFTCAFYQSNILLKITKVVMMLPLS